MSVYQATADQGAWRINVHRDSERLATLTVTKADDDSEILREEVGLAYGAVAGPDVDDVWLWQTMAIEAIDHYKAQQERSNP